MSWQARQLLSVVFGVGVLHAQIVCADNLNFFGQDQARTVFGSNVEVRVAKFKLEDLPKTGDETKTDDPAAQPASLNTAPNTTYESTENQRKQKEQEIIAKYGDPDAKPKIRTVDNAPPEFKCMMEALDNGLDELAYRCAKKWKLAMANLANLSNKVGSIMPEVEKELGNSEEGAGKIDENSIANRVLSERAKEILKQAEQDIKMSQRNPSKDALSDDQNRIDRAAVHKTLVSSGKVPVDPQGKVYVLYFIDPTDLTTDRMTQQIEALRRAQNNDPRVTVVSVTHTKPLPGAIKDFKSRTRTTMAVSDGSELATKLGVVRIPTTVFMSPNLKKAVMEDGFKPWEYMDELVRVMKGES